MKGSSWLHFLIPRGEDARRADEGACFASVAKAPLAPTLSPRGEGEVGISLMRGCRGQRLRAISIGLNPSDFG